MIENSVELIVVIVIVVVVVVVVLSTVIVGSQDFFFGEDVETAIRQQSSFSTPLPMTCFIQWIPPQYFFEKKKNQHG